MGCTGSAPLEQPSAAVAVPEIAVAPPTSTVDQNPLQIPERAPTPRPNSGADNDAPSPLHNDDSRARAGPEHDDDGAVADTDATVPPLFALLRDDADTPSQAPGTSASVDVFERRSSTRALTRRASQRRPHHANFANPFALRSDDSDAPPPTDQQQQPRPLSFCNVARLSLRRGAELSHDCDDFSRDPRLSTTTPINAWLAHLDVPSADVEEADAGGGTAEIASQN